ncbi:hypothetical protein [Nocardia aurea]|uniref:hypothetical protein n=1 Tax=Nocardia aurea TaxID=2144174 RepID=UPI0033AB1165
MSTWEISTQFQPGIELDLGSPTTATASESVMDDAGLVRQVKAERRDAAQRATQAATWQAAESAAGGPDITTALAGPAGDAIAEALALQSVDRQARAVAKRIELEEATLAAELERAAVFGQIDELLSNAFTESAAKRAVPPIVTPFAAWWADRVDPGVFGDQLRLLRQRLTEQHAQRRADRVRASLPELDAIIRAEAERVLSETARVADALARADIDPGDSAEKVLDTAPGVAQEWRAWRVLTARWADIQSSRRWVGRAALHGFDVESPARLGHGGTAGASSDVERELWVGQFAGVRVLHPGADHALRFWCANGKPDPVGVGRRMNDGEWSVFA